MVVVVLLLWVLRPPCEDHSTICEEEEKHPHQHKKPSPFRWRKASVSCIF